MTVPLEWSGTLHLRSIRTLWSLRGEPLHLSINMSWKKRISIMNMEIYSGFKGRVLGNEVCRSRNGSSRCLGTLRVFGAIWNVISVMSEGTLLFIGVFGV